MHWFGLQGLQTFCAVMNMSPAISRKAYDNINKKILLETQKIAKQSMISATKEETKASESPDFVMNGGGTWKTRGHFSEIGECSVIGIKIADVKVLTNYCKGC